MSTAKELIDEREKLAQKRTSFDSWWQQVALRVMPADAQFTVTGNQGEKRTERLFTGKPENDNNKFAAVMADLQTPHSQLWHELTVPDKTLEDDQEAKVYLARVNELLFRMRYRSAANFAGLKHQGYLSVGAFGNSCMFIDEEVGVGPRYKNVHLSTAHWAESHQGRIDLLHRKFTLTGRQALQKRDREGWKLPQKIVDAATKEPLNEFEFIHCTRPNEDRISGRLDDRGKAFQSFYVSLDSPEIVSVGGFRVWPYSIGRYALAPNEQYGRGPAMVAWPAIMTLNEQKKTILRAGQMEVTPPVLLAEDGLLEPFNLRPGALNHGLLTEDGQALAQPFKTGANIPLGLELMNIEVMDIEEAFLVAVFKVLQDHPNMTATQVLELTQQKATLLAPMVFRQQSEDLGPLIEAEVDILAHDSRFAWIQDEMPDSLREAGGKFNIEYRSPLARAMRASDGVAIMRTFEALPAAMQIDPDAALVMDVPASFRELANINGVPAKLVRDPKLVEMLKEQKRQQEELQQMAAAAPAISQSALNAAKAEQLRAGA